MTPAERWARVAPGKRALIARAMLDRLDSVAVDDVEAAARYLEAEPPMGAAEAEAERQTLRRMLDGANRRAEAHKGQALLLAAEVARLEALVSKALDAAHDEHDPSAVAPDFTAAGVLVEALHEAKLYDAEEGEITPAGEALQLRAATKAIALTGANAARAWAAMGPEIADCVAAGIVRPLRVYVAGGSSEVELVARYVAALRAAGVEITEDWSAAVLGWRSLGSPPLTAAQRAAHARADLEGIERADVVWWILPDALSEGSAFEAGYALGRRYRASGYIPRAAVLGRLLDRVHRSRARSRRGRPVGGALTPAVLYRPDRSRRRVPLPRRSLRERWISDLADHRRAERARQRGRVAAWGVPGAVFPR